MAMLVSYRRSTMLSPEGLANEVDRSLKTSYGWDMLNDAKDYFGFKDISLPSNASLYPSPDQWYKWLKQYGPLWVTVKGGPSHAIIVTGITGDLTPGGTTMSVLNPWDHSKKFDSNPIEFTPPNFGTSYTRPFKAFASDFGNMELGDYGEWRILYLPP
jgi:hypothetical protein